MRVQLLTLRFSPTLGGFDDTALRDAQRDRLVLAFREHFFVVDGVPHLACVLEIDERPVEPEPPDGKARAANGRAADPARDLSEHERLLFNTLREWRAEEAREQGVPPYVLFTNRQLVAIVRARPESANELGRIQGVGPAKVERYGAALILRIHGEPDQDALAPESTKAKP